MQIYGSYAPYALTSIPFYRYIQDLDVSIESHPCRKIDLRSIHCLKYEV